MSDRPAPARHGNRLLVAVIVLAVAAVSALLYWQSDLGPESRFVLTYAELVVCETCVALSAVILAVRFWTGRFPGALRRQARLRLPLKVAAVAVAAVGIFVFGFWTTLDILSGYNAFPAYAFFSHPSLRWVYDATGLGALDIPDKNRLIGFIGFCLADAGLLVLRLEKGIGTALRDVALYFAAPAVLIFELAILATVPAEMYWHVTSFLPWSLDRYLNAVQFEGAVHTDISFVWAGNIYLVSNWFALSFAAALLIWGVWRMPSASPVVESHPSPADSEIRANA